MPGQRGNTCLSRGDEVARVTASCLSGGPSQNVAPTSHYHGNCLFAPFNPISSVTRAPQLEVGEVGRLKITCRLSLFSFPSSNPSLGPSPRGCWVHPPPGPHRPAVLCAVGPGRPGAGFEVEGRQVLGRQLPGQREQGVSEVVAMGT